MGILDLFGLSITKIKPAEEKSAGIVAPMNDDGAIEINTSSGAGFFGVYVDVEGAIKNEADAIRTYRELASFAEVDKALMDIVDEAIPHEDDSHQIDLIINDDLNYSDVLRNSIQDSFKEVLNLLNFEQNSSDIFKKWYVDGRLYYQIIVDKKNLKRGIIELRPIESTKIKKVREIKKDKSQMGVDIVSGVEEYFVYNETGFSTHGHGSNSATNTVTGAKLSPDTILYVPSGQWDITGQVPQGFLHKAIRPINQLRMMEDSLVVNRVARAPERRIFYVDTGSLPKGKAESYLKDMMNQYRNKMVYDSKTGMVKDEKKYMSMLEDYWLPRRDGNKGTEITTLPGASNLGQIEDVTLFQQRVYDALNVPISRMNGETGFSLGRTSEISRDEFKFQKFIDKLRRKFSLLIYDALKTQLILKGICNDAEWEQIKSSLHFRFQRDNYFSELKNLDILQARMAIMPQIDPYLGKYFSKLWTQKTILGFTEEQIKIMDMEIDDEQGDPMAKPSFAPGGFGDDGSGGGGGQPPPIDGGGDPTAQEPQDPNQQQ
jgi:hypothetical protein